MIEQIERYREGYANRDWTNFDYISLDEFVRYSKLCTYHCWFPIILLMHGPTSVIVDPRMIQRIIQFLMRFSMGKRRCLACTVGTIQSGDKLNDVRKCEDKGTGIASFATIFFVQISNNLSISNDMSHMINLPKNLSLSVAINDYDVESLSLYPYLPKLELRNSVYLVVCSFLMFPDFPRLIEGFLGSINFKIFFFSCAFVVDECTKLTGFLYSHLP